MPTRKLDVSASGWIVWAVEHGQLFAKPGDSYAAFVRAADDRPGTVVRVSPENFNGLLPDLIAEARYSALPQEEAIYMALSEKLLDEVFAYPNWRGEFHVGGSERSYIRVLDTSGGEVEGEAGDWIVDLR